MYRDRVKLYEELEKEFETKLLVYVTGDRVGAPIGIAGDAVDGIVRHLDSIRRATRLRGDERIEKLSLFLYTPGGDIHASLTILNLLKTYCNKLQVIIPRKAQSAGTFICIGADELVMTKQATLGPVDPSVTTPFNPRGTSDPAPQPVSVEAVEGYFDYAKEKLGVKKEDRVPTEVFLKLSDLISPLTLGDLYRLKKSVRETTRVSSELCSFSPSH
ncbi:MAG: ATP-dependent Clp protease proteolytic subunit [Bacteroidales bacterium]|nr:ATP-dependent Clp protease proteolytic subunit [Bacteroidales bacterium]